MRQAESSVDVLLRPMRMADVPRVRALDVLSFSLPWSERSYRYEVGENINSSCWVAEISRADGTREVVGMLVNWVIIDELHIATIAVHPDYRRMGIGRKLLIRGLQAGIARGTRMAYLEVRRSNQAAQAMYQELGFVVDGVRPGYYQDNQEDALLMTLEPLDAELIAGWDSP